MIQAARLLIGCALALLAGSAIAQPRGGGRSGMGGFANPSAVIAAEMGFNRLAQTDGQWTAFRKTADKDAVMFMPQAVNAQRWLRAKADPAKSVVWWPSRVFMACDGSYGASTGSWQAPDGTVGYFTTIWRRQKNGSFRWLLDHGDATATLRSQRDDDLEAKVAECARGVRREPDGPPSSGKLAKPGKEPVVRIADPPPANGAGQSGDGSLRWSWDVRPDGNRTLTVTMLRDGEMRPVIEDKAKGAPAP